MPPPYTRYTVAGGILSVAYTDIFQGVFGLSGMFVATIWIYSNMPRAMGVSPGYPLGDAQVIGEGFTDIDGYDPLPNAVFFNWATIIVLGFGNICAIDFQARVMAAKDGKTAQAPRPPPHAPSPSQDRPSRTGLVRTL